eukprot:CAMPEP_0202963306 /NCGR_PEP_ID=MMETSP1396-20130829/7290_1 /ASSEMBLY_ACC=CAM_ASM_000872 /TAXON_ID= /ORGANISM="Pseudokeronopsis sp., Strain Brazil" /LENGTH=47 /DNA_ID= /DNA_START= /DNA_END= /DNA_ORIENTATION=
MTPAFIPFQEEEKKEEVVFGVIKKELVAKIEEEKTSDRAFALEELYE